VRRSYPLLFGCSAFGVALDQWSKHWATAHLAFAPARQVVGDLVQFTYTRNSGIAFGIFQGRSLPLYVFSLIAAIAVVVLFSRHERMSFFRQLSLACILGGAVGNMIDRITTGQVVDFILLQWRGHEFPVFNVADVFVSCGVALFALAWTHDPQERAPESAATPERAPNESHGGADGAGPGSGPESGPLAGEGADRPVA
jgi:signal peptidase II